MSKNRERITIILGAGHSQALGIPGTAQVTAAVDDALLASSHARSFSNLHSRMTARYGNSYSFELVAAALEICERIVSVRALSEGDRTEASNDNVLPDVAQMLPDIDPGMVRDAYDVLIATIRNVVGIDWRAAVDRQRFQNTELFYEALKKQYALDIVTLNYDLSIEEFVPDAIDGFGKDGGKFDVGAFLKPDDLDRIAHLHGSLRFAVDDDGDVCCNGDRRWAVRPDGVVHSAIITGLDKPNKLSLLPYSVYNAWLAQRMMESPRVVVIGYGAGDMYLNAWLHTMARHHGPAMRAVLIDRFSHRYGPPASLRSLTAFAEGTYSSDMDAGLLDWGHGYRRDTVWLYGHGFPPDLYQRDDMLTFLGGEPLEERESIMGVRMSLKAETFEFFKADRRREGTAEPEDDRFETLVANHPQELKAALQRALLNDGNCVLDFTEMVDKKGREYRIFNVTIVPDPAYSCFRVKTMMSLNGRVAESWYFVRRADATTSLRKHLGDAEAELFDALYEPALAPPTT